MRKGEDSKYGYRSWDREDMWIISSKQMNWKGIREARKRRESGNLNSKCSKLLEVFQTKCILESPGDNLRSVRCTMVPLGLWTKCS